MSITITVPNDDHVALRAMAKALEEIAVARGAPEQDKHIGELNYRLNIDTTQASAALEQLVKQAEVDTTAQQFESLNLDGRDVEKTAEMVQKVAPVVSDTDSTGTPWDERIHSASKALNSDGTWRVRRKPKDMDEAEWSQFMDSVLIEITPDSDSNDMGQAIGAAITEAHSALAEQYGEGLANAAFTGDHTKAPEPSVTPKGDDFHVDVGEVTEQQVASIPAPPPPPVVTPAAPVYGADDTTYTFPQVMQFLTERHGRITSAQVDQIIGDMGLNSIMDLNTQPEHTGPFIARVKALLGE